MTVFQPFPPGVFELADADSATLYPGDFINPISGGTGITTIKCDMTGGATVPGIVSYTPTSTTYTFSGVSGNPSAGGLGATFTVVVSSDTVTATLENAGDSYVVGETITIDGPEYGGMPITDNIVITITEVETAGEIVAFTQVANGSTPWPQELTGGFIVPLSGSTFVQVNSGTTPDGLYVIAGLTDGSVTIQPVTVVG